MPLARMFKGLAALNIGALRLLPQSRGAFVSYLEEAWQAYSVRTMAPVQVIDLPSLAPADLSDLYLPVHAARRGGTPWFDLVALATLTASRRPKTVFEIGTFDGLGTLVMQRNAGSGVTLYSLDLNPQAGGYWREVSLAPAHVANGTAAAAVKSPAVTFLTGNSMQFDYSPYHGSVDFFFVDGDHSGPAAWSDTLNAFRCIKPDGMVVWHDVLNGAVLEVLKRVARVGPVYYIRSTAVAYAPGRIDAAALERA